MARRLHGPDVAYAHPIGDPPFTLRDAVGALALTTVSGEILEVTDSAKAHLRQLQVDTSARPAYLPFELQSKFVPGGPSEYFPLTAGGTLMAEVMSCPLADSFALWVFREPRLRLVTKPPADRRFEAIGKVFASVAHDLRAPLASLAMTVEALAHRTVTLPPQVGEMVRELKHDVQRMQESLDGVLDYAKKGPRVRIDVSLFASLTRVSSLLRPLLRAHGHPLHLAIEAESNWVCGNPTMIEQIFIDLIMNAIEAGPGPIAVSVRTIERAADDSIQVCISNDGPAIPGKVSDKIFLPFFTTKTSGTGLGLTNARELACEQEGDLWLDRTAKETSFILRLPPGRPSSPMRPKGFRL